MSGVRSLKMEDRELNSRRTSASLNNLKGWSLLLLFCLLSSVLAGCSADTQTDPQNNDEEQNAQTEEPADQIAGPQVPADTRTTGEKLVGIWLGAAYFDEQALNEKMAAMSDDERAIAIQQARYFGATIMAIDFRADGSMINQVEILPESGDPQQPPEVSGTWQIVDEDGETLIVETVEQSDDGTVQPAQRVYQFYEDGDHFAMRIPLTGVLGDCSPMLIFERQYLQAEAPLEELVR